ncbi:MAG: hypothetical protein ACLGIV_09885 [Actinomycetes bacterium]
MASRSAPRRHLPNSPFTRPAPVEAEVYEVDDRVTHDRYGLGTVERVEDDRSLVVRFTEARVRVTPPYTRLHRL